MASKSTLDMHVLWYVDYNNGLFFANTEVEPVKGRYVGTLVGFTVGEVTKGTKPLRVARLVAESQGQTVHMIPMSCLDLLHDAFKELRPAPELKKLFTKKRGSNYTKLSRAEIDAQAEGNQAVLLIV
jgi:hypothetical protein